MSALQYYMLPLYVGRGTVSKRTGKSETSLNLAVQGAGREMHGPAFDACETNA